MLEKFDITIKIICACRLGHHSNMNVYTFSKTNIHFPLCSYILTFSVRVMLFCANDLLTASSVKSLIERSIIIVISRLSLVTAISYRVTGYGYIGRSGCNL